MTVLNPTNSQAPIVPIYSHHIFASQRFGGINRYFVELSRALNRSGVMTETLAPIHVADELGQAVAGIRVPDMRVCRRGARLLGNAVEPVALRYWRRRFGPSVVLHRTYYSRTPAPPGIPRVETVHDMIHERFPQYFARHDVTREEKRIACENADMIIAVSNHTKRVLVERLRLPAHRIRVCHHGVSSFPVDKQRLAELGQERPFLLFVGSRWGYKNFASLVRAFGASEAAKNGIGLRAFGGGPPAAIERALIASLGLSRLVQFDSGSDAELSAHYASAIALVYPSLEEGFGLPPLEAMSHACPVVASDGGAIPEVVGEAALLFDPRAVESIANAIDSIVSDDGLRRTLSSRGVRRAAMFTWDDAATRTLSVYEAALELAQERA